MSFGLLGIEIIYVKNWGKIEAKEEYGNLENGEQMEKPCKYREMTS